MPPRYGMHDSPSGAARAPRQNATPWSPNRVGGRRRTAKKSKRSGQQKRRRRGLFA